MAEKALKKINHIEYIDETSDSGSEADSESSDSSSEVSETESEMAALEAAGMSPFFALSFQWLVFKTAMLGKCCCIKLNSKPTNSFPLS